MKNLKTILFFTVTMSIFLVVMNLIYVLKDNTPIDVPGMVLTVMLGREFIKAYEWLNSNFNK